MMCYFYSMGHLEQIKEQRGFSLRPAASEVKHFYGGIDVVLTKCKSGMQKRGHCCTHSFILSFT